MLKTIFDWATSKSGFESSKYSETRKFKKINRAVWNVGSLIKLLVRLFVFLFVLTVIISAIFLLIYQVFNYQDITNILGILWT